jgi:predicted RND superfamily exporter protein
MQRDLLDVLIDELGRRFPRFGKVAPVVALVALILIVGFGLYALSSLF